MVSPILPYNPLGMKYTLLAIVVVAAAGLSACRSSKCCTSSAPVVDGKATVVVKHK